MTCACQKRQIRGISLADIYSSNPWFANLNDEVARVAAGVNATANAWAQCYGSGTAGGNTSLVLVGPETDTSDDPTGAAIDSDLADFETRWQAFAAQWPAGSAWDATAWGQCSSFGNELSALDVRISAWCGSAALAFAPAEQAPSVADRARDLSQAAQSMGFPSLPTIGLLVAGAVALYALFVFGPAIRATGKALE